MTTESKVVRDDVEVDSEAELTPEQLAELAKDKKLASENARVRTKLREAEKERDAARAEAEQIRKEREEGSATDQKALSENARLAREIADLRKENKERKEREAALEEKTRTKTIASALSGITGKLNDPTTAVELLQKKAKLAADDTVVFLVKNPDTGEIEEKEATYENIKAYKLVPEIYFPAQGSAGSGGRGGAELVFNGKKGSVDLERAKTDVDYYTKNRDAILAARTAMKKSNADY